MVESELKVGGLQKQTVSNCGSLVADPVKTKWKKHQILDEEVDRLEEQLRHMRSVRHGQRMEPRAVSLHDNRMQTNRNDHVLFHTWKVWNADQQVRMLQQL